MATFKKTILIDLDGVLNQYSGIYDENNIPPMVPSQDLFGLMLGAILWFPPGSLELNKPKIYPPVSIALVVKITKNSNDIWFLSWIKYKLWSKIRGIPKDNINQYAILDNESVTVYNLDNNEIIGKYIL